MWNCPVCGSENNGKFCSECGREKTEGSQETIRIKKVEAANFDGGVTVNYKVDSRVIATEKKSEKKKLNALAITGISVIIAVAIFALGLFGYYVSAKNDFASGRFEIAEEKFNNINFFLNSKYMADKCVYEGAKALLQEGMFEQAKLEFSEIKGFEDSDELIFECDYSLLLKYKDSGDFESAAKLLDNISEEYKSGSKADEIEEIELWCNYAYAKSIIEKEPKQARELLEEIDSEYEDVKDLILECTYLLAKTYESEGKYDEAREEFKKCVDYKDSEYLLNSLQSNILTKAIAAFGDEQYDQCRELIEMCEDLSEEEKKKADAYKLFLSYKADFYQRPAVNSRLFSYLGSYTEARNIVLEDGDVFSDFLHGSWQENGVLMFTVSNSLEISQAHQAQFPEGKCKYESGELIVNSESGHVRIIYDIEIINKDKIKVHFANDSSEHILTRL